MKTFHENPEVKEKYLKRARALIEGGKLNRETGRFGWIQYIADIELEPNEYYRYEKELGIPMWLISVGHQLFNGASEKRIRSWPEEFLKAIPVGVDVDKIKIPFLVKIIERNLSIIDSYKFDKGKYYNIAEEMFEARAIIKQRIETRKKGDKKKKPSFDCELWSVANSINAYTSRIDDKLAQNAGYGTMDALRAAATDNPSSAIMFTGIATMSTKGSYVVYDEFIDTLLEMLLELEIK